MQCPLTFLGFALRCWIFVNSGVYFVYRFLHPTEYHFEQIKQPMIAWITFRNPSLCYYITFCLIPTENLRRIILLVFYLYLLPHFSSVTFNVSSLLLFVLSFKFQQSRTGEYRPKRALIRIEECNIRAVLLIFSTRSASLTNENKHKHSCFYKLIWKYDVVEWE
jgi:hypothetical protein